MKIPPWEEFTINLIGTWNIKVNGRMVKFNAITCIDTASNLVELIRIENKTAAHVRSKFLQYWISRYPRPMLCMHDKGVEFIGQELQWILFIFSVKYFISMSNNPQFNYICNRIHQTVGNGLRTELYSNLPQHMPQAKDIIYSALATLMHVTSTTIDTTLGSTPGSMAFIRDMFLNIHLIVNWKAIHKHCEHYANENIRRANLKRRQYDYAQGQKFLKKVKNPAKLGVRKSGTYNIERVRVTVTINIEIRSGIIERINI